MLVVLLHAPQNRHKTVLDIIKAPCYQKSIEKRFLVTLLNATTGSWARKPSSIGARGAAKTGRGGAFTMSAYDSFHNYLYEFHGHVPWNVKHQSLKPRFSTMSHCIKPERLGAITVQAATLPARHDKRPGLRRRSKRVVPTAFPSC